MRNLSNPPPLAPSTKGRGNKRLNSYKEIMKNCFFLLMLIFPIILGAVVFAGQNPKDIPLKPIDEPKVMVLINEKIGETRTTNCETAIVDKLLEYKFNLVDPA
ncbi:MAG: hypothetical protein DRG50_09785, partial [Deltaproteobacteria bacterium]